MHCKAFETLIGTVACRLSACQCAPHRTHFMVLAPFNGELATSNFRCTHAFISLPLLDPCIMVGA